MKRVPNLDKVYTNDKHYPYIIETLLTIFKHTTDIQGNSASVHRIDKPKFDEYIDTHYPADKYELEDLWFEGNKTAIYVIIDEKQDQVKEVFISHDDLDIIYSLPSSYWSLFDTSKEIKFVVGTTVGYQYKPCYKPDVIRSIDEVSKIRFKLIELVYKELDPKFKTDLTLNVNLKDDVIEIIPVFNFTCGVIEDQVSSEVYRIESVNKFLDKFYEMEDILRTIQNYSLNEGV